jgi:hypothetical protein
MPTSKDNAIRIFRSNADEAAILAVLAKLKLGDTPAFTESEETVLAALRRSSESFANSSVEEISQTLSSWDEDQIIGLSSNVKGILHELDFARLENEDGDQVLASLFPETTHPGFDIQFQDLDTGDTWAVQLKATDNEAYVSEWLGAHPDGEILVTEEIAEEMDLPTTGFSNEELKVRVDDFLDRMVELSANDSLWNYFPALSAFSVSVALVFLWKRQRAGEIGLDEFKKLAVRMTGLKIAKIASIILLLGIPGVGVVTSVVLVTKLLISVGGRLNN